MRVFSEEECACAFFHKLLEFVAVTSEKPSSADGPEIRPEVPLPEALARLDKGRRNGATGVGRYAGVGLQFAASLLFFLYVGQWMDRKLGTDPLFLYLGVATGAGAAFYSMYRSLMADQRREEQEKLAAKQQPGGRSQ